MHAIIIFLGVLCVVFWAFCARPRLTAWTVGAVFFLLVGSAAYSMLHINDAPRCTPATEHVDEFVFDRCP
jgi:hypothetical protein